MIKTEVGYSEASIASLASQSLFLHMSSGDMVWHRAFQLVAAPSGASLNNHMRYHPLWRAVHNINTLA